MELQVNESLQAPLSFEHFRSEVLRDYRMACISREASLLGRKEVLTGKAKFGIFGDGKEVPQLAMAKFFKPGDFYSGYYRDQTFAFATGAATVKEFFAQLYSDPDTAHDPHSAGRQMNSHFATPFFNEEGEMLDLVNRKNLTAGMAPTAAQMPRSVGLALASKLFRNIEAMNKQQHLTRNGNEVCFATIGDASTSEGHFWETLNAAAVQQIPLAVFVWDDGYGISVPKKYQTTKGSVSEALKGFQVTDGTNGMDIYKLKAWDYAGMCEVLETAIEKIRHTHIPALFHVEEVTQPQGHSTSGSHERYKTADRLQWERDWDCIKKMKEWMLENDLATEDELFELETEAKEFVRNSKTEAWSEYQSPILKQVQEVLELMEQLQPASGSQESINQLIAQLRSNKEPNRRDVMSTLYKAITLSNAPGAALVYYEKLKTDNASLYNSHLHTENKKSAMQVPELKAAFDATSPMLNGYEIINRYFDQLFASNEQVVAFGEDLGYIGDVNQGFAGLQAKYSANRIFDTGIRELTIMGQGIGLAMRGFRPIAEIQYLDYLVYGLQPLTDDVSTLQFRTAGKQGAPLIVRTRGHRLEGIWHSGSPMGMIINSLRGMYVCVPRNMVQAAGMYNTLLQSNEPGLVIECLNGYRLKEKLPTNLNAFTVPMGVPEVIKQGTDITIVSYGSTLRIIDDAIKTLELKGVSCEVVDVQTLLPFDINHVILESLKKTNRIVFIDEDVPGGAAAYMFNKVMEEQGGYRYLDVAPRTITAKAHRPSYGSDGDYFSKPNAEEIIEVILKMMNE
ncbi:thiamine pyrophosphate-dependent enzyme [Lacibacter sp. MH-610]|uniref:alpha-ketoacid dehydrogenase subunit alpha/beta n=1 Tax=Lacibacter sp. MH-610 TaxID=3020883 RepID=UPI00389230FD